MDIMERGSSYATLGPENEQGTRAKTERSILVVQPKISKGLGRFGCQGTERMPKADEAFTKTRHPLQTINLTIATTVALYKRKKNENIDMLQLLIL